MGDVDVSRSARGWAEIDGQDMQAWDQGAELVDAHVLDPAVFEQADKIATTMSPDASHAFLCGIKARAAGHPMHNAMRLRPNPKRGCDTWQAAKLSAEERATERAFWDAFLSWSPVADAPRRQPCPK